MFCLSFRLSHELIPHVSHVPSRALRSLPYGIASALFSIFHTQTPGVYRQMRSSNYLILAHMYDELFTCVNIRGIHTSSKNHSTEVLKRYLFCILPGKDCSKICRPLYAYVYLLLYLNSRSPGINLNGSQVAFNL